MCALMWAGWLAHGWRGDMLLHQKRILWKKYFKGVRNKCIENPMELQKGLHIMKAVVPLVRDNITLIPRSGKEIMI
jgi:hypothetical protein